MASSIGNSTAEVIVDTGTLRLINEANLIVKSCTGGPECNTSIQTRNLIKENLSKTAQEEAINTLKILSVPPSSVLGRNIYNGYIELAANVSAVYIHQCGSSTVNATACVTNASSVQSAQTKLRSLLVQPATDEAKHIIVLSILLSIGIIAFIIFIVFFIIGIVGALSITPVAGAKYMKNIEYKPETTPVKNVETQVAVPVSPFDTTESIY